MIALLLEIVLLVKIRPVFGDNLPVLRLVIVIGAHPATPSVWGKEPEDQDLPLIFLKKDEHRGEFHCIMQA